MGPLALPLTLAAGLTAGAGTIMSGNAAAAAGQMGQNAKNYEAQQLNQNAVQERAVAQRQALDKARETTFALSGLQARAAASGGSAQDPTVVKLGGDIAGRGKYEALADMYQGENRARGLEAQAKGDIYTGEALKMEGDMKREASYFSAAGTVLGSAGSMARQYGELSNPYYRGRGL